MPNNDTPDFDGMHVAGNLDADGCLVWRLTDAGRDELAGIREYHPEWDDDTVFLELIEDLLCNGCEIIRPEDIGALTGALIITDDAGRDDDGTLDFVGRMFHDHMYAVRSTVQHLEDNDGFGASRWLPTQLDDPEPVSHAEGRNRP